MAAQFVDFFLNMDPAVRALKTNVQQLQQEFEALADAEGKIRLSALPGFQTYAETIDPEATDRLVSFEEVSNIIQQFYVREVFPTQQRLNDGNSDINVRSVHTSKLDSRTNSNGALLVATEPHNKEMRVGNGKGMNIYIGWGDDVVHIAQKISSTTHIHGNDAVQGNLSVGKDATVDGDTLLRGNSHVLQNQVIDGDQTVQGASNVKGDFKVGGNQQIQHDLDVKGNAIVRQKLEVFDSERIHGDSLVNGASVIELDQRIKGAQVVEKDSEVLGSQRVVGAQHVQGISTVGGDSTVEGKQTIRGEMVVEEDMTVLGKQHVMGASTIGGSQTINGACNVHGDSILHASLAVAGDAQFAKDLEVNGSCQVRRDLNCDGAMSSSRASVSGNMAVGGKSLLSGGVEVEENAMFRGPVRMSRSLTVNKSMTAQSVNVSTTSPGRDIAAVGACVADAVLCNTIDAISPTGKVSLASTSAACDIGSNTTQTVKLQAQNSVSVQSGALHTDGKTLLASGSGRTQLSSQLMNLHAKLLSLSADAVDDDGVIDPTAAINITAPQINFVGKVTFQGDIEKNLIKESIVADKNTTMNDGGASGSVSQASDVGSTIGGGHRWTETDATGNKNVVAWSGVAVGGDAWEWKTPNMHKPAQANQGLRDDDDVIHRSMQLTVPLNIASGGTGMSANLAGNRAMMSSHDGAGMVEAPALGVGQLLFGVEGRAPVAASITSSDNNLSVQPLEDGGVQLQMTAHPSFESMTLVTALPTRSGGTNSSANLIGNCPIVSKDGKMVEGPLLMAGEVLMGQDGSGPTRGVISGGSNVMVMHNESGLQVSVVNKPEFQACTLREPLPVASGGTGTAQPLQGSRIMCSTASGTIEESATLAPGQFVMGGLAPNTLVTGGIQGGRNITVALNPDGSRIVVDMQEDVTLKSLTLTESALPVSCGGTGSKMSLQNQRIIMSQGGAMIEGPQLTEGRFLVGVTGGIPAPCSLESVDTNDLTTSFTYRADGGAHSLGIALLNKIVGAWNNSTSYHPSNIVCCDAGWFRCVRECINDRPPNSATGCWMVLVEASSDLRTSLSGLSANVLSSLEITGPLEITMSSVSEIRYIAMGQNHAGDMMNMTERVMWVSEDESIAKVGFDGKLHVRSMGTVRIAAYAQGLRAVIVVTIAERFLDSVEALPITLQRPEAAMAAEVVAVFSDDSRESVDLLQVLWTGTSDAQIATVSSEGIVTAHNLGNATITGVFGNKTFSMEVVVRPVVTAIALAQNSIAIAAGDEVQVILRGIMSYGPDQDLPWEQVTCVTDSPGGVTVTQDGKVIALSDGIFSITFEFEGHTVVLKVLVEPQVTGISLDPSSLVLVAGESSQSIDVLVAYSDASIRTIELTMTESSSNKIDMADVNGNLIMVPSTAPLGTALITVSYQGHHAQLTVSVVPAVMIDPISDDDVLTRAETLNALTITGSSSNAVGYNLQLAIDGGNPIDCVLDANDGTWTATINAGSLESWPAGNYVARAILTSLDGQELVESNRGFSLVE